MGEGLDGQHQTFSEHPLDGSRHPHLNLDATNLHGRPGKTLQACSYAVVVTMGVHADGRWELLEIKFQQEMVATAKVPGRSP